MREGLCNQCEDALYEVRLDPNSRDFKGVEGPRVLCYRCGVIRTNARGYCVSNCSKGHGEAPRPKLLEKIRRFFSG